MTSARALSDTQAFFRPRAAGWEERYPNDEPQFARAVAELAPPERGTALDLGCGTGRALPFLRAAVGPAGRVLGIDVTDAMLAEAVRRGRGPLAVLLLADVARLPLTTGCADVLFAGGLLPHLEDPLVALREWVRVTRADGRLIIFHAVGRVTLAARHGGVPSDDDVLAPGRLAGLLAATGWRVLRIDDAEDRFAALAVRHA
jgi:SAM-dependent methyltransferase